MSYLNRLLVLQFLFSDLDVTSCSCMGCKCPHRFDVFNYVCSFLRPLMQRFMRVSIDYRTSELLLFHHVVKSAC